MAEIELVKGVKAFLPKTRKQWRAWLQKNHVTEKSVWLILYRKESKMSGIDYAAAVEEALCFGWIDSTVIGRDAESRYQYFTRRKSKSGWSKSNRERVERLIREGLMTPAGQAIIDLAKKSGTWEAMVDVENLVLPDDLKKRFGRNKKAFQNFSAFSPSSKKIILAWILNAKRPETRSKRIDETVTCAARNEKAYS
jgi:uncharacterized protein YdeI (YjbR/CyaY-like superfamily)